MFIKKLTATIISAVIMLSPMSVIADETVTPTNTSQQSFETMYGSQLMSFLNHQYYFEGEAIPVYESNFYFINAFLDLTQYAYYGYYPSTTQGFIDLSSAYTGDEYATFGDYYVAYAENIVESTYIICEKAEALGLTISDETNADIDAMIAQMGPDQTGMSVDDYLQLYYGPGMTEAAFRDTLSRYYLADVYSQKYCDEYEFSDDEKYVPNIRYALFYAPQGSDDATLQAQEAAANDLLASCTDIADLQTKANELYNAGTVYEANDILVPKGKMVPSFEEWAYGEGRTEGEMAVIKSDEYGYFVVGYLGLEEQSAEELEPIALEALSSGISEEIESGAYEFYTNDTYVPASAVGGDDSPAATLPSVTDPQATAASGETQPAANGVTNGANTIVIVLATLGGVAIVALVGVLIYSFVKANKSAKKEPKNTEEKITKEDEE
ncbi:MAG: hypothetical protein K5745_05350 [Saccharofermentans sp.]|nr:hypothetical protein [Saccharofermentans sp.]